MRKSLLQQLYDGEIYPAENINPKGLEYREVRRRISDEKEHFKKALSLDEGKRFQRLDELYDRASALYSFEHFAYGFKLGIALMAETLTETNVLNRTDE